MKVQAIYTVAELAKLADVERRQVYHWLSRDKIEVTRVGRSVFVTLIALQNAMPSLWQSIRAKQTLTPGTCSACGNGIDP